MKKRHIYVYLTVLCCTFLCLYLLVAREKPPIELPQSPSYVMGRAEQVDARLQYTNNLLINPRTKNLPPNIIARERAFVQQIPASSSKKSRVKKIAKYDWQPLGPNNVGGRTRALAIDQNNESVIMAGGVSGGIWRSENNGNSWQKITSPLQMHNITCLVQDPRDGHTNTWYYGTGEIYGNSASATGAPFRGDGIFKSTDGGNTWNILQSTASSTPHQFDLPFNYCWNLVINPTNLAQQELYAAVFGGIVRSVDGGTTWATVLGYDLLENQEDLNQIPAPFFTDICVTESGVFYASLSHTIPREEFGVLHGVFRSEDGVNWTKISPDAATTFSRRIVMDYAKTNENIVYFLMDGGFPVLLKYEYIGANGQGLNGLWQDLTPNLPDFKPPAGELNFQGSYNMLIKSHPTENALYIGGTNLYLSTDAFQSNGQTYWVGGYDQVNDFSQYDGHHADQHALAFYPSDPRKMLSGHDGGVSYTSDNLADTISWTSLNNGYITSQYYSVSLNPSTTDQLMAGGMQDNGTFGTIGTTNWSEIVGGDGGYTAVTNYNEHIYISFPFSEIYRMHINDDLDTYNFARVDPYREDTNVTNPYLFVNPYLLDPNNPNRMYLAAGNEIWYNSNLSQIPTGRQNPTTVNWRLVAKVGPQHQITALALADELDRTVLLVGTNQGKIFKIINKEGVFTELLMLNTPQSMQGAYVSSINFNENAASEFVCSLSNYEVISIYRTTDGGDHFQSISGNLEEFDDGSGSGPSVRWVTILPLSDENLYLAGTSAGLFVTTQLNNDQTIWEFEENIGNVVVSMIRTRTLDGKVAVATHGNGVYSTKVDEARYIPTDHPSTPLSIGSPYPNPKDLSSEVPIKVPFYIPKDGHVFVGLFNNLGKRIMVMADAIHYQGMNEVSWNGRLPDGSIVSKGVYYISLIYNDEIHTKRVVLQ